MQLLLKIILAPLFFLVLTPVAIVLRLLGVDLIEQKLNTEEKTYWQTIDTAGSTASEINPEKHI